MNLYNYITIFALMLLVILPSISSLELRTVALLVALLILSLTLAGFIPLQHGLINVTAAMIVAVGAAVLK